VHLDGSLRLCATTGGDHQFVVDMDTRDLNVPTVALNSPLDGGAEPVAIEGDLADSAPARVPYIQPATAATMWSRVDATGSPSPAP
jgi:hypothetical protein